MDKPCDDRYGSAVVPVAAALLDPVLLLDELERRVVRCSLTSASQSSPIRMGVWLVLGECACRIASNETNAWWTEHGLFHSNPMLQRRILEVMLSRSPRYLVWAAIPLFNQNLPHLLDPEAILRIVQWVTDGPNVDRVARDAIALGLVVPWLDGQSEQDARKVILSIAKGKNPGRMRIGLMTAAGYLRGRTQLGTTLTRPLLDLCWSLAEQVDPETAMSVGWLLRELLNQDPHRVLPELIRRAPALSRQAMRTAVERLPRDQRLQVSAAWLRGQRAAKGEPEMELPVQSQLRKTT